MTTLYIYLKNHFPRLYQIVRQGLFPIVDRYRDGKRKKFTARTTKQVEVHGRQFSVVLDPANGFIDSHIFITGAYELDILAILKEHLAAGNTFVDIGGNIGWHSLFAASIVGPSGHVHTFEPLPKLQAQFTESIANNQFEPIVTLHPYGLSDKNKTETIYLNRSNMGNSSLFIDHHGDSLTIELIDPAPVLEPLPRIDLIKIDTEGSELEVIRGLAPVLMSKRPALIIEFSPAFWGEHRHLWEREFMKILRNAEYRIFDIEASQNEITNDESWLTAFKKVQTNLLCLPK